MTTTLKWVYGPGSCYRLPADQSPEPDQLAETLSRRRVQQADLLFGHALFGLHRHLEERCRHFTLLRDPVRRVVSHYFYHKVRYPSSALASLSLKEFLQSDHPIAQSNRQVRFLSGQDPRQSPRASLTAAKDHLRDDLVAFGLTERFDESLFLFRARLDWGYLPFYVRRKVNSERPTVEDLSDETVEAVRKENRLDAELYRFAQDRFKRMLEAEVPNLEPLLYRFRRWNRLVQTVAPPLLALYRKGRALLQEPSAPGS